MQDHILKEYHNISTGMSILKSKMEKMSKEYDELETMRDSLVSQMEALGLEVSQSQNVKKSLLPTQETQTQPQDITEQETAITSITTPTTKTDQYTLPQELHQFIQTTGKLNTEYHTDDYILTIQQSPTGERILSIEQKAPAATNEPMTQLSAEDILQILNAPSQPPTSLTSLPGTDMIPVPVISLPSNPQPGTSAQGVFSATDPQLPVPPPGVLEHAQDLLKRHEALKSHIVKQPIAQPSGLGKSRKEEEEEMEVIDDDDNYVQPDDGDDNDDNEDEGDDDEDDGQDQGKKKKYIKKQHGKPVPPHLQNLKRSYCECGKSYSCGSDLKGTSLKNVGKQEGNDGYVHSVQQSSSGASHAGSIITKST